MGCFQVFEENEGIETCILRGLEWGHVHLEGGCNHHPALLIVSPQAALHHSPLSAVCRTILLPGDTGAFSHLQAASAVSYGLGAKNTLTLSSHEGQHFWIALQRELVTIHSQVVDRQEFFITSQLPALPTLAAAGALLLLGVPPDGLSPTFSHTRPTS